MPRRALVLAGCVWFVRGFDAVKIVVHRLMRDIREGIRLGTLSEVEARYVHPDLQDEEQAAAAAAQAR
jgi:hypothetical protein